MDIISGTTGTYIAFSAFRACKESLDHVSKGSMGIFEDLPWFFDEISGAGNKLNFLDDWTRWMGSDTGMITGCLDSTRMHSLRI